MHRSRSLKAFLRKLVYNLSDRQQRKGGSMTIKPSKLRLRCYAKKEADGSWYAACLDLNLLARGNSFQEVSKSLHQLIREYVKEAFTHDRKYLDDLIPRRPPIAFLYNYYFIMVTHKILKMVNGDKSKVFTEHLPLTLAHA